MSRTYCHEWIIDVLFWTNLEIHVRTFILHFQTHNLNFQFGVKKHTPDNSIFSMLSWQFVGLHNFQTRNYFINLSYSLLSTNPTKITTQYTNCTCASTLVPEALTQREGFLLLLSPSLCVRASGTRVMCIWHDRCFLL